MQIAEHTIVRFHYDLADEAGQPIESSREREPMAILYGAGNVIPGVEKAIEGRSAGERLQVTVPPAEGYGERREGLLGLAISAPRPLIDAAVGELVGYERDSLHRTDLKRFALRPDPPGSLD